MHDQFKELCKDIHYVGYYSPEAIAEYLLSRGWTKRPPAEPQIVIQGVDTETHWANGQRRLLTPEAYERMKGERQ